MRIAVVCPYDLGRHGGVQDQAIGLSGWLRDHGHDVVLVGPGTDVPPGAVGLGATSIVRTNRSTAPISLDPRVRRRVREALEGADVVHIHEPLVPMVGPAALRGADAAIVATFHADPSRLIRRTYRVTAPALRRVVRRADVVTAVSPVAMSAVDRLCTPRLISNGVDVSGYCEGPKEQGRLVFLGRDDPRKGLDVLLSAWPSIRDAQPGAHLDVVGAERSAPPDGVRYHGPVTDAEKRRLLAAAEVFVAPNTGGESFGITLAEAMASGCAVVASALPAFAHVLGGAGVLVPPADPDGLAAGVIDLLRNGERLADLRRRSEQRAGAFDWDAVAEAYLAAYRDAVLMHS